MNKWMGNRAIRSVVVLALWCLGASLMALSPGPAQDGSATPAIPYRPLPDREPTSGSSQQVPLQQREVPGPLSGGGIGKRVAVISIEGTIDMGLAPFVVRTLQNHHGLDVVVLVLDTPGGRIDAALAIRDALLDTEVTTVAFVHPRAISAGALISYGCDVIAMGPGASIGAATPVSIGPGGAARSVGEKVVSYFRTEMAATARAKGRRGDIAEAMVDPDVQIEDITPAGKLLTLDTDNALALGVAEMQAENLDDLLAGLYMDGAEILRPEPSWAERLARFLTHPAVSGLLMALGFLGIMVEFRTPGFGVPGIVGLASLAIFFFGHMVVHLAGWEELILFGIGAVALAVEIFVIPGFGVAGVVGILALLASLVLALSGLPLHVSFSAGEITMSVLRVLGSAALAVGGFALVAIVLPRTRTGRPLVLRHVLPTGSSTGSRRDTDGPRVGDEGRALTILRPAGKVRLGNRTVVAESEGPFIDRNQPVVVVRVQDDRVSVRARGL